jgi:hypothetical protein
MLSVSLSEKTGKYNSPLTISALVRFSVLLILRMTADDIAVFPVISSRQDYVHFE